MTYKLSIIKNNINRIYIYEKILQKKSFQEMIKYIGDV